MRYFTLLSIVPLVILFGLTGCNEGLDPNEVSDPGFGGTISFISKRPPLDSLLDLRVVAVPYFPVDTSMQTLISKVFDRVIPYSDEIRVTADSGSSVRYEMRVKPKTYYYLAVVQRFGIDLYSKWRVVGVHVQSVGDTIPKAVTVPDGKFIHDINFTVDFYRLPPQPFKTP